MMAERVERADDLTSPVDRGVATLEEKAAAEEDSAAGVGVSWAKVVAKQVVAARWAASTPSMASPEAVQLMASAVLVVVLRDA